MLVTPELSREIDRLLPELQRTLTLTLPTGEDMEKMLARELTLMNTMLSIRDMNLSARINKKLLGGV